MKRSTAIGLQRAAAGMEAVRAADSQLSVIPESRSHAPKSPSRRSRGYTVVELVVVMAVAAILARIAFPALMNMVRSSSVTSTTNQLVASLNWARNQALIQHTTVTVCKSITASASTPSCDTASTNTYAKGWLVFLDANNDGAFTTAGGDTLLKAVATDNNNSMTATGTNTTSTPAVVNYVKFTPMGMLSGSIVTSTSPAYIVVCDDRGWANSGQYAKVIALYSTGRIATALGTKQSAITTSASTCSPS